MVDSLQEIVSELREADRQERIEMLIDFAKQLPPFPDRLAHFKDESHRVPECQSPVFLIAEMEGERVRLYADAPIEAPTVRGFVALLIRGLDGESVQTILSVDSNLIEMSGMTEILGMLRVNGLHGVLNRLKRTVAQTAALLLAENPRP